MAGIKINILSNFNAQGFDKLNRELKRLDTPMEKLGATTRALAPAATIALGALAVGAAKSVGSANDLALSMREVVTLTGDTGDEAEKTFTAMKSLVSGVSSEFGVAQETLTKGLYQALSAGVPKDNALEFMQVATKASIAGVTDVDTAVDGLTTVINAFGLEIGDASSVADAMFAAVKGGKTTFDELSSSLFNVAPSAAAAGAEFTEVAAAIATLTASGVPTSVATNQIKAAFVALSKPSKELNALFQDLGFESGEAAIAQEGLQFAMDAVFEASNGSAAEMKRLLGRQEAVNAINVLSGTSAGKFADELERQAGAAGSVDDAFQEIDKNRGIEKQAVAFENMSIAIGDVLLPIMQAITPVIISFANFIEENSTVVAILAGVLGVLAAAILLVNFALNANPIVKIITVIGILIAAIIFFGNMLIKHMGGADVVFEGLKKGMEAVGKFFEDVFKAIGSFFGGVFDVISARFESFVNTVIGGLNRVIDLANGALSLISAVTGGAVNIKIPSIPTVKTPKVRTRAPRPAKIPKLALGGIVMPRPGGVFANLAEAGQPEAVIPLDRMGDFQKTKPTNVFNITVSGGVGSGATIGKAIVEQIKAYERTSGPVFVGA